MSSNGKKYTLITGASNGIGKAMAFNCASRGFNVLLVALPEIKLEESVCQLKEVYPGQHFDSLGIDLCQQDSPERVYEWCLENEYEVNMLINNAGMGNGGAFLSRRADFYEKQMHLNMISLVMLTHRFLPDLQAAEEAYILNVSSLAAFYDIPYKSIYSASKKFVYSFSQSLRKELEHSSVKVTVLCPAAVLTNPEVIQREKELGRMARWTQQTTENVAEYAISHMLKGYAVAIPGRFPKIYRILGWFVPYRTKMRLLANAFVKQSR